MPYQLEIKAFFFNAKTDYLPYYKIFTINISENAKAKELLEAIKLQNENFSYPKLNLFFKVNDLVVGEDVPVSTIIEKLGNALTIDPITSYRSNNGLIINDDDFMQSFELLAPYATSEDKDYYQSLYALHYASETSNFERQYIGDAILILAHKMITEGNKHKTEILNAITSVNSGLFDCEYENNLFIAEDYSKTIMALKQMAKKGIPQYPSLLDIIKKPLGQLGISKKNKSIINTKIENIEEKTIAYYPGQHENQNILDILNDSELRYVRFKREKKLSGTTILKDNKILSLRKAGATILDAFDAGAEVLIIEDTQTYHMMQKYLIDIQKVVGREIIGLSLISSESFLKQLHKETI